MKNIPSSLDEFIERWSDSLLRGKRAPTVVVFGIILFFGTVLTVLLQHPISAGKIHDEANESARNVETTALIQPLPSSADPSPGQKQKDALPSHLDHGKNEVKASQLPSSELESELSKARSRDDITAGQKHVDGLASQPDDRAVEQIRASQVRISELEAELSQRPTRDDINSAQRQTDELRSQLDQATEQFKTAELQASQLQAELNQRPTRDDLNSAQSLADDLRSRLGQAREQLRASELRANQLQAEVNQRPTRDELNSAQRLADELRSQLDQASEQLRASQVRISEQEKELQAHNRAAQLTLIGRGDALLSSGDITSARLFYERAAEAGNAEAALRLGEIYDPAFLRRSRFQAKADSSRASFWYGRARELGSTEAEILLNGLQPR